jgi:hypothetical protein
MKQPYFIQRGTINRHILNKNIGLDDAVTLDYMGSAEFEYGALPESLIRISKAKDNWIVRKIPEILHGESPLLIWSALSDEDFIKYGQYLIELRKPDSRIRTFEYTEFEESSPILKYFSSDFWWDIKNDTMFAFNEVFMMNLPDYIATSIETF